MYIYIIWTIIGILEGTSLNTKAMIDDTTPLPFINQLMIEFPKKLCCYIIV